MHLCWAKIVITTWLACHKGRTDCAHLVEPRQSKTAYSHSYSHFLWLKLWVPSSIVLAKDPVSHHAAKIYLASTPLLKWNEKREDIPFSMSGIQEFPSPITPCPKMSCEDRWQLLEPRDQSDNPPGDTWQCSRAAPTLRHPVGLRCSITGLKLLISQLTLEKLLIQNWTPTSPLFLFCTSWVFIDVHCILMHYCLYSDAILYCRWNRQTALLFLAGLFCSCQPSTSTFFVHHYNIL